MRRSLAIRITFETVGATGEGELRKHHLVSASELLQARMERPMPAVAAFEAQRFWEAVLGMGLLDADGAGG